jgi:hypothetical protein
MYATSTYVVVVLVPNLAVSTCPTPYIERSSHTFREILRRIKPNPDFLSCLRSAGYTAYLFCVFYEQSSLNSVSYAETHSKQTWQTAAASMRLLEDCWKYEHRTEEFRMWKA